MNHDGTGIAGGGPDGPTGPFLTQGRQLEVVLAELATMVGQLSSAYEADSIRLATSTIETMRGHMTAMGEHAAHIAQGFDGYVEKYHEARNRVPEPVPFAAQLETIQEHHPGLLARVPFVAELEEEHNARTREAREIYRQLDQAAVTADDTTPEFPMLADTAAKNDVQVAFTDPTAATAQWPNGDGHSSRGASAAATSPAGSAPPSVTSTAPASAPTPGAGAGSSMPAPTPIAPGTPGSRGVRGVEPQPGPLLPGHGAGGGRRAGRGDAIAQPSARAGGAHGQPVPHDITSRGGRGSGPEGGRVGGVGVGAPAEPAARTATRGVTSGSGLGTVGPMSAARQEDQEHKRRSYLEADDPNALFGTDQRVAPPVIGVTPPSTDHR